jgi:hypothetical protein
VLQPEPKTAAFFVGTARSRSNWADSLTSNCTGAPSPDRGFILNPRAVCRKGDQLTIIAPTFAKLDRRFENKQRFVKGRFRWSVDESVSWQ